MIQGQRHCLMPDTVTLSSAFPGGARDGWQFRFLWPVSWGDRDLPRATLSWTEHSVSRHQLFQRHELLSWCHLVTTHQLTRLPRGGLHIPGNCRQVSLKVPSGSRTGPRVGERGSPLHRGSWWGEGFLGRLPGLPKIDPPTTLSVVPLPSFSL